MKNKQFGFGVVEVLIAVVVLGLIGALSYVAYKNTYESKKADEMFSTQAMPPLIRGVYGDNVSSISKYNEAPGLHDALRKIADNNPCQPTEGRYKLIILGVTSDKTQALMGNSCGSTGVLRNFMIREGDGWKLVGGSFKDERQRNDFSELTDTPSCELVELNNIQKSIAPVCFELKEGAGELLAGDLSNYIYIVR